MKKQSNYPENKDDTTYSYQQVIGISLFLPVEATYEMHDVHAPPSPSFHDQSIDLDPKWKPCRLGPLGTRSL